MKKVLVTGANGFIGRHCLPLLTQNGYEVHAIYLDKAKLDFPDVHWHQADILHARETEKLVSFVKATHLLHLAWYTEHKKYWTASENHAWVGASFALVKAFNENGGKRAVIAGTCAEYDWEFQSRLSEDSTPLAPATIYGACRDELRKKIEEFSKESGLSSAWARIFFVYGPGEHPARLVSSVIASLLQGKQVPCSKGEQERDFLFVEDVASAFVSILESDFKGAINIGSGSSVQVKEVINIISNKIGRPDLIQFGRLATPANEPKLLVADASKIRNRLGWKPRYGLNQGMDKTIAWWKEQLKKDEI